MFKRFFAFTLIAAFTLSACSGDNKQVFSQELLEVAEARVGEVFSYDMTSLMAEELPDFAQAELVFAEGPSTPWLFISSEQPHTVVGTPQASHVGLNVYRYILTDLEEKESTLEIHIQVVDGSSAGVGDGSGASGSGYSPVAGCGDQPKSSLADSLFNQISTRHSNYGGGPGVPPTLDSGFLLVYGDNGANTITVSGSRSNPVVTIDGEVHTFSGSVNAILIKGYDGDDNLSLSFGVPVANLSAGKGNDTVTGGPGYDFIHGGEGDDTLDGGPGPSVNTFLGWKGTDTIYACPADTVGTAHSDTDTVIQK